MIGNCDEDMLVRPCRTRTGVQYRRSESKVSCNIGGRFFVSSSVESTGSLFNDVTSDEWHNAVYSIAVDSTEDVRLWY